MKSKASKSVVWSKDGCAYCTMAKQLLKEKGIPFEERNISSGEWTREQLFESVPNVKTVPQIFLYGEYVGGYTELLEYVENHGMYTNE